MWNWSLKFYFQQFVPFFVSSSINLYDINFKTPVNKLSAVLSCIILPTCIICAGLIFYIVKKRKEYDNFEEKYGEIVEDLKISRDSILTQYWKPLNLIRWLLTVMILIILRNYPSFQILLFLALSVLS